MYLSELNTDANSPKKPEKQGVAARGLYSTQENGGEKFLDFRNTSA